MKRVELQISFIDDDQTRTQIVSVDCGLPTDIDGENRVAFNFGADLKVIVGDESTPEYNETARGWLNYQKAELIGDETLFKNLCDFHNLRAMWLELSNLVLAAESDLILARAYKSQEPSLLAPDEDSAAINNLFYLHDRKMSLLNAAVHALIKVRELVNRLLHEALGGDVVDTKDPDWERNELTRKNVLRGLCAKLQNKKLSQSDYNAILAALRIPNKAAKRDIALTYRNRLEHHLRPSVDYPMFFSGLQSRKGEEVKDPSGKVTRQRFSLLGNPPADYKFSELDEAFKEYLAAIVKMLVALSRLRILHR